MARRSDGTTSDMRSIGPVSSPRYAREVTFLDGRSLTLFEAINVKSTWPRKSDQEIGALTARLTMSPPDCGANGLYKLLGFGAIMGQEVATLQHVVAGKYRVTRWMAPKLGCEDLYYQSETINSNGSFTISAEEKTSQFVLGEPMDCSLPLQKRPSPKNTKKSARWATNDAPNFEPVCNRPCFCMGGFVLEFFLRRTHYTKNLVRMGLLGVAAAACLLADVTTPRD